MTPFNAHRPTLGFPTGANRGAAGAYTLVQAHTAVDSASPHALVNMLYDGLHEALVQARGALSRQDIGAKCAALSKSARIVDEGLKACLNLQQGGELAQNLHTLYNYVSVLITKANLNNDDALLAEALRLIQPLRDAWHRIGPQDRNAA